MDRRKFLSYMAVAGASALAPREAYSSNMKVDKKNQGIKEKNTLLKVLNDNANFSYNSDIFTKDWASELIEKDMGYIVDNSKNILNSDYIISSENKNLNISKSKFEKIITTNPHFMIPLMTKIMSDAGANIGRFEEASISKENNMESGFWYVKESDKENGISGNMSIPYLSKDKILLYGEGSRFGVTGKFISLINYKDMGSGTNIDAHFFVKPSGENFISSFVANIAKDSIAKKIKNETMGIIKYSEKLDEVFSKSDKQKYDSKEVSYLENLLK